MREKEGSYSDYSSCEVTERLTVGGKSWKGSLLDGIETEIGILAKGSLGPIAMCKLCQLYKPGYRPSISICCLTMQLISQEHASINLSPAFHSNVRSSVKSKQVY